MVSLTWTSAVNHRPKVKHLLAFFIAFLSAAGLGQWLLTVPGVSITVWPPNGVFLAVLLLNPRRTWPWWILVALLAELTGNALWFAYNSANALEVATATWLLSRRFSHPARLETLVQIVALIGVGVIIGPMIGATIGSAFDAWNGKHAFAVAWPLWWIGDATGVLISAPLTLVIAAALRSELEFSRAQITEATAVAVALCGLGVVALAGQLPIYLVMPALLWAAVRFEFVGAVTATALLTLIIAIFSRSDLTQFTEQGASDIRRYASMQLFLAMSALIGLIVAAISKQWHQALVKLSTANDELEARVAERTAALQESEARFRNMADHAPVMSWITDTQGQCTFLSRSWYTFTGQTEESGLGTGWLSAIHPDDSEEAERKFHDANAAQVPFRLEYRLKRGDGEWRWAIDAAQPRFGGSGEFLGYIGSVLDITERHDAEKQKHLLLREVNHRAKNLLTLVQAVARQTVITNPDDFIKRFGERLNAISASQDLLVKSEWEPVPLEELIRTQLAHLLDQQDSRIGLDGPLITVSPPASQTLGMVLHELATNATKYGSLSSPEGRVEIRWAMTGGREEKRLVLSWIESGGPEVCPPVRRGFGSKVISDMITHAFDGQVRLDYAPEGLSWRLDCALRNVEASFVS